MKQGPVYLAGIERSGTSLMYALLGSHPNIAMTRRTNLWSFFYNQYGDLRRPENFERCLAAMLRYKRILKLHPDQDRIRYEFSQGEPTYARLFALLEQHHAEREGKPRWGDKSLNQERYVNQIFAAYPDARMIQMVRDPRDRYASALTRWKLIRGRAGSGLARWLWSVEQGRRNERRYPERYMMVRYEALATHPEETLRMVCSFLGEEYTPAMLSMEGAPTHRNKGGNSSYGKRKPGQISTSSIGRFRTVLSPRDIAFMQAHAGYRMTELGYALDPVLLPAHDRLIYTLVDSPLNLGRMLVWRAREVLRDRMGRSPSLHTIVDQASLRQT